MFEQTFKNIDEILHKVLDLPGRTFTGARVKTVVLYFEKGSSTKKVWFYQLNLDRNFGKTNAHIALQPFTKVALLSQPQ